eukprot:259029-Rhodomonas_salina.1
MLARAIPIGAVPIGAVRFGTRSESASGARRRGSGAPAPAPVSAPVSAPRLGAPLLLLTGLSTRRAPLPPRPALLPPSSLSPRALPLSSL